MDKIFIRNYSKNAGKWIYNGYANAFEKLGYEVERYGYYGVSGVDDLSESLIMMTDSDLNWSPSYINDIKRAKHVFLFVSPNNFPEPWGSHFNYVSMVSSNKKYVEQLNSLDNVTYWTFVKPDEKYYGGWGEVKFVPLAFDKIGYIGKSQVRPTIGFDVVFVGSWANNGFDSKKKIMKRIFAAFKESDLKCGFFINKGLTLQEETDLLANSSVCLNIHDDYQKILGLDTNERTFKALGLNGNLVSDFGKQNEHMESLGLNYCYPKTDDPEELVEIVKERIPFDGWSRSAIRKGIKNSETYVQRAESLLEDIKE